MSLTVAQARDDLLSLFNRIAFPCHAADGSLGSGLRDSELDGQLSVRTSTKGIYIPHFPNLVPIQLRIPVLFSGWHKLWAKTKMMLISSFQFIRMKPRAISVSGRLIPSSLPLSVFTVLFVRPEPEVVRIAVVEFWRHIVAMADIHSIRNLIVGICDALAHYPHDAINEKRTPSDNMNHSAMRVGPGSEPCPYPVRTLLYACPNSRLDSRGYWRNFSSSGSHSNVCRIVRAIWPLNTALSLART